MRGTALSGVCELGRGSHSLDNDTPSHIHHIAYIHLYSIIHSIFPVSTTAVRVTATAAQRLARAFAAFGPRQYTGECNKLTEAPARSTGAESDFLTSSRASCAVAQLSAAMRIADFMM